MIDIINLAKTEFPQNARGHVSVDFFDPVKGNKKKVDEGKNHIYLDSLLCGQADGWVQNLSDVHFLMTVDDTPIDQDLPILLGSPIGYGLINQSNSGSLRGTYVAAQSFIRNIQRNANNKIEYSWRYVYSFLPSQAQGDLKSVGLTFQTNQTFNRFHPSRLVSNRTGSANLNYQRMQDGSAYYTITNAGILRIEDPWIMGNDKLIDLSGVVGTSTTEYKCVGYDDTLKLYYVFVGSATAANRKLFEWNNPDFSGTPVTLTFPDSVYNNTNKYPFYVYDRKLFFCDGGNGDNLMKKAVQGQADVQIVRPPATVFTRILGQAGMPIDQVPYSYGAHLTHKHYFISLGGYMGNMGRGWVYNMKDEKWEADVTVSSSSESSATRVGVYHPKTERRVPFGLWYGDGSIPIAKTLIAQYKYTGPVRNPDQGITITYDVVVEF